MQIHDTKWSPSVFLHWNTLFLLIVNITFGSLMAFLAPFGFFLLFWEELPDIFSRKSGKIFVFINKIIVNEHWHF